MANGVEFLVTDLMRLDGELDAVCLSIHSINGQMFDAKKRQYGGEWLILEIDASILWTHSCRFCRTNAAATEMRRHGGFLGGPWAFSTMFEDRAVSLSDGRSYRSVFQRADCQPTDQSAEVQVFNSISPDAIVGVTVRNQSVKNELETLMHEVGQVRPVEVYEDIFR